MAPEPSEHRSRDPAPDDAHERRVLDAIIPPVVAVTLGLVVLFLAPGVTPEPLWTTVIMLAFVVPALGGLWLARSGHVRAGSNVVLGTMWLSGGVSIASFGGIRSGLTILLPLVVLLGGALRGLAGARLMAVLASISATVLYLGEAAGHLPLIQPRTGAVGSWLTAVGCLVISVILLRLVVRSLDEARGAAAAQAERAERNERRLAELFAEIPDGIVLLDTEGAITSCNPAVTRITGYSEEELVGLRPPDWPALSDGGSLEQAEAGIRGALAGFELLRLFQIRHRDGHALFVEARARIVSHAEGARRLQVVMRDVTERHRAEAARRDMEQRLAQNQRLESIGRLAGGVAHDFRNLLTAVMGNAEILRSSPELPGALGPRVDEIIHASERGADITRQLLTFARRQEGRPRPVAPVRILLGLEPLLQRLSGAAVELRLSAEPHLPSVAMDHGQLEQILLNLVTNARDAIDGRGAITVALSCCTVSQGEHGALAPGRYVCIDVRDDGVGMDERTVAQAFDPFFTTKETGRGTGLGLATVHGIVREARGHVAVDTAPGLGSTFRVYLPAVDAPREATPPGAAPRAVASEVSVLLVDDDAMVREAARRMIEGAGMRITVASGAAEALELVGGGLIVDVLVTDVIMPHIGGPELAARLREERPTLPVVFVSGYTRDEQLALDARTSFVEKPFRLEALLDGIAQVTNAGLHRALATKGA